jgi:glycosyltransferase involved in cell wall biosynthesis
MPFPEAFPRVLFITPHAFNKLTGTGITFTNLFGDWPKDRIATAHDDSVAVTTDVCDIYYRLGSDEIRKFGGALTNRPGPQTGADSEPGKSASGMLRGIKKIVFGDGLPQRGVLSPGLEAWIEVFRPDVIYTILGSNGLMDIVEAVHRRFGVPLVVHIMDDWMAGAFRGGLLGPIQRRRMLRGIRRIIEKSSLRLGICDAMCEAYSERYGAPFRTFQNVVDTKVVARYTKDPAVSGAPVKIVYAGSVFAYAQRQSLIDCCLAIEQLADEGLSVRLDIHCPRPHIAGAEHLFAVGPAINLHGPLTDNADFFSTICAADILLIPVNFDRKSVAFIRYSMPTRVPAYLASGTPILVYGPPGVAQVQYAADAGWGLVLKSRSINLLKEAIARLIEDLPLRIRISDSARSAALAHHDMKLIREKFKTSLAALLAD